LALDIGVSLVGLAAMINHLFIAGDAVGSRWWLAPLYIVVPLALLWRRSAPLVVLIVVVLPIVVQSTLTGHASEGVHLVWPLAVALYSLGAYSSLRHVMIGVGAAIAAMAIHDVNDPAIFSQGETSEWAWAFWLLAEVAVMLLGVFVGAERQRRRLRREQLAAERLHAETAAAAVTEERARIARELHDVVTHNVNVVVLQAMAASGVLDSEPARARAPLAAIEESGREALVEMRRLLGVLRTNGSDDALRAPQPGIADLAALVAGVRDSGFDAALEVDGDAAQVPIAIALAVYRVAQEALTNAMKHAAGATVIVQVRCDGSAVEIEVVNSASASAHTALVPGGGHGLAGLRERIALFGGHLIAGPRVSGGFGVWARVPLEVERS
jgi:signal transduction histidine kinase